MQSFPNCREVRQIPPGGQNDPDTILLRPQQHLPGQRRDFTLFIQQGSVQIGSNQFNGHFRSPYILYFDFSIQKLPNLYKSISLLDVEVPLDCFCIR